MNLSSGYPYSLIKNGYPYNYPSLKKNISCDVAIIGGGISGALAAYYLVEKGVKVAVFDRRHIGMGSTAVSTSLLQYELDIHLCELIKKTGKSNSEKAYKLCSEAIFKLHDICRKPHINCDFFFRKSIYLASFKKDIPVLKEEAELRKAIGIEATYINSKKLKNDFGIKGIGALVSEVAGEMDVSKCTHGLFKYMIKKGCEVYDKTEVNSLKELKSSVVLSTNSGYKIKANKVVFATGYESQLYLKQKVTKLHSTYAILSSPIPEEYFWKYRALIWETARPYLYARTTVDNRILLGGRDEMFYNPEKRDGLILKKAAQLTADFKKLFPKIPFEMDFAFTGTFAESKDGLPYIGITKEYKHAYFALGSGGNGIIFGQIAGEIICDLYLTGRSEFENVFSFSR